MRKLILLTICLMSCIAYGQTNSRVTELYLATNFTPKSGITEGSDDAIFLDCDQILSRYNVTISGVTTTGNRLPSQNQLTAISTCPSIGDSYGGGVVAYLFVSGDAGYVSGECHGIIAQSSDLSSGIHWHVSNTGDVATSELMGSAVTNTNNIVGLYGAEINAARICYTSGVGGFTDWVLPSLNDLTKLEDNYTLVGNLSSDEYWSSSQVSTSSAWYKNMLYHPGGVSSGGWSKVDLKRVRAIRYF